jgi:N-acetylmuramoyl-L-alanine amidase
VSFTKFLQDDPLLTRAEYMRIFMGVAAELDLPEKAACVLAAMCCFQEAGVRDNDPPNERRIWCPANPTREPDSLKFPHDTYSDDGRSVGICQQQRGPRGELWWGTVADEMNPRTAIRSFMSRLPSGFHANDAWAANNFVQGVQRSGVPDAYAQWWGDAIRLYNEVKAGVPVTVPPPAIGNLPKDSVPDGPWNGDPVWLPEVLRAEGVKVVEYPGWRTRGHGDMGNLWGVVCHHTGNNNAPPSEIANGFPHLRGPLSQIHLARDGTATIIAAGVSWHAGSGAYPGLGRHNANLRCIGIEAQNDGKGGWPKEQYDAYVRICAAFCRQIQVDSSHVISHQEWDDGDPPTDEGKWDPGGIDMPRFRGQVQTQITTRAPGEDELSAEAERMIREMHVKMTDSLSMYANGPEDRTSQAEAYGWDGRVESSALRGEAWALNLVRQAGDGTLYGVLRNGQPDQFLVDHARAVYIEAKKLGVIDVGGE